MCWIKKMPTATATHPPPANSPNMHSRLVYQNKTPKQNFKKLLLSFAILAIWHLVKTHQQHIHNISKNIELLLLTHPEKLGLFCKPHVIT